jgi:hypothetical protein
VKKTKLTLSPDSYPDIEPHSENISIAFSGSIVISLFYPLHLKRIEIKILSVVEATLGLVLS